MLVLQTTIETGGQPSAVVIDRGSERNDVIFYDGDRVRFIDGDTLTLYPESIPLPTTEWEGWMVYDTFHQQAYVVTVQNRETPMHVFWKEVLVHIVADRTLLGNISVNSPYNSDPLNPADRFYGLHGLALKEALAEGTNSSRLILDDTANGNIDVVDLNVEGTDAQLRQRHSYRETLCSGSYCVWELNQGNGLALETKHETVVPDDLANVDVLYISDPNREEQGLPLDGYIRSLQLNHPLQNLDAVVLPDLDLSSTWPFGGGIEGLAIATGRDVLYVASGQQSFDTGYVGEVNTVTSQVKQVIELTYADQGFVHVDRQDPLRVFVGAFDGWYNDPDQALYLHMFYDGSVIDTLRLVNDYDEYNGLRDMTYDPLSQRLYLTVGSRILVVQVNHGTTCPSPLTDIQINGPPIGQLDTSYAFHAVSSPSDVTPPVTYTWSPVPLNGQGTAQAIYSWATTGVHSVTVEAENCGGKRTATLDITIVDYELTRIYLPVIVR